MIYNQDWLNYNKTRKYPFKTGVTSGTGVTKIPNDFIVDAVFAEVPRGDRVYLSDVTRVGQKITLVFKTDDSLESISIEIDGNNHTNFDTYSATGGTDGRMFAAIAIADISTMLTMQLDGGASYGLGEAEVELRCLQFGSDDAKVTALSTEDDGILLRGNIELRTGPGLKLTTNETDNAIKIDFDSLADVTEDCECPPNYPFVRTINGLPPDCNGNFCFNADGFNVVENDGNCLTMNTTFEPNQICIIESGVPGPLGPQGPAGATKPGGGLCCEVAADPICCESCLASCITSCAGDPFCEETCCSSCFVSCGGPGGGGGCPPVFCPCPPECMDLIIINISCCSEINESFLSMATVLDSTISAVSTLEDETSTLFIDVDQNTSDVSTNSVGVSTNTAAFGSVCTSPCADCFSPCGGGGGGVCDADCMTTSTHVSKLCAWATCVDVIIGCACAGCAPVC